MTRLKNAVASTKGVKMQAFASPALAAITTEGRIFPASPGLDIGQGGTLKTVSVQYMLLPVVF
jgi:hypothetical protein